tara:strand:+ start:1121 stop:2584 length:1464 start_codon:yes stop_codon:yes gene_type:complete
MSNDLFQTLFGTSPELQPTTKDKECEPDSVGGQGDVQSTTEVREGRTEADDSKDGEESREEIFTEQPELFDRPQAPIGQPMPAVPSDTYNDVEDGGSGPSGERRLLDVSPVLVGADQSVEVQQVHHGLGEGTRDTQEAELSDDGGMDEGEFRWFPGESPGKKELILEAMKDSPWSKRETGVMSWEFEWAPGITEEQKTWSTSQLESVIPRMGAKSKLRDWLVEKFPKHHSYVEPFGGSFKVLLWKHNVSKIEIINDADSEVIHFFRCLTYLPEELTETINNIPTSQEVMKSFKGQLARKELTGIERAAAFYVLTKMTFNGTGMGFAGSIQSPMNIAADTTSFKGISRRLKGVDIRNDDAFHLIKVCNKDLEEEKYPGGVFFYIDPPYDQTYGYKSTNGIELGFGWGEQKKLYDCCCAIDDNGNKFIQTNSATDRMYKLYGSRFTCVTRDVEYIVSSNVENRGKNSELIIANFDITKEVKGNMGGLFG